MHFRAIAAFFTGILFASSSNASVYGFEELTELEQVDSFYAGLQFSNSVVLTAGSLLNEIDFPPHSGSNIVVDDNGAIEISFLEPVYSFAAYFTYTTKIRISAELLGSQVGNDIFSAFDSNVATDGDFGSQPNEFISFSQNGLFDTVRIIGSPDGYSFVMDDFSYSSPIPEPASILLLTVGLLGLGLLSMRHADIKK